MILNIERLNKCIESKHFKTDSLQNGINMVKLNMWMASVNIRDAYYSAPLHEAYQKYLKSFWNIL